MVKKISLLLVHLNVQDNALLQPFDGRTLLIYVDPVTHLPDVFFTTATHAEWRNAVLRLNNGLTVEHGIVRNADAEVQTVERPLHLFIRWYGFAALFPNCDLYRSPLL
jgi:hypothetical protein